MLIPGSCYVNHQSGFYLLFIVTWSLAVALGKPANPQYLTSDLKLPNLPNTTIATSDLYVDQSVCFKHSRDPRRPALLHPAKVSDCAFVFYDILRSPTAAIPLPWHHIPSQSPQYVRSWRFQTCRVLLLSLVEDKQDWFPEMLVARQAALIVEACVSERAGYLGGFLPVGRKGVYEVVLCGEPI